ncbi:MAG: hypothetical protein ACI9EF_002918 [Pseudohongiellaceae bacterium]|jgi:hypothetical protein
MAYVLSEKVLLGAFPESANVGHQLVRFATDGSGLKELFTDPTDTLISGSYGDLAVVFSDADPFASVAPYGSLWTTRLGRQPKLESVAGMDAVPLIPNGSGIHPFAVTVTDAPPGTLAQLAFSSVSATSPFLGCSLLLDHYNPTVLAPVDSNGVAIFNLPISKTAPFLALLNSDVFLQAGIEEAGTLYYTNALRLDYDLAGLCSPLTDPGIMGGGG